jgi:Uma2 family endonuclease
MVTELAIATNPIHPQTTKRSISLEKFLDNYTNREDPFKYEWHKGSVEKKARTMNRDQFSIIRKLCYTIFMQTAAFKQGGMVMAEVDMFLETVQRTRRTDIAYLTPALVEKAPDGKPSVCPFVIEIISKNDQINEVNEKIIEYFANGVEVVWVILPKIKKVEVYTSVKTMTICFGEDICTAAPVLPDFKVSVNDLLS